ncbi:unnamed protein product [Rotaria sp. Silwood2]|nr:unnamed protein product [Rotaria sp. Silwood2]CAF2680139.1 unnamed protein product [Rotaria sp. Silwood2]CAF2951157.1 unnamed protein product [Rotaria sp. Silwood2]CAF3127516.1 unnamed protein product [Rotaria sp. Silwood2]CAF4067005.1 unnamed protein product [Rotaria sp. Silwood2]
MTAIPSLPLLLFMAILFDVNAQWFIMKKNYPSKAMNYPNPGKRSITEEEFKLLNIDCSIPYSYFNSYKEKMAWLLSCSYDKLPLTIINDSSSSSSSSSNSNSIEDELYSIPEFISQERRTPRSIPPYFHEHPDLFNRRRLLKRLRRFTNK